jgi:D-alanyl-D-alanine carboxypeptidase (penicillin-binding protein 5/6)
VTEPDQASQTSTSAGRGARRGRHRRQRGTPEHPHRRRRWILIGLAVVLVAGTATFVTVQMRRPDAVPMVVTVQPPVDAVPADSVTLPWPTRGEGAVAIPSLAVETASASEVPVPVASLTKLMTAYVVLRDHPLIPGEQGPSVTVTPIDAFEDLIDSQVGNTNVQVAVGETLSESQLLGGLLVHSADNFADILAQWDAGSAEDFVEKMNEAAAGLGMTQTHFADASGVSDGSMSTAADILKVAEVDLRNPVVAGFAAMPSVTLPVAGKVSSYTPLLGADGVIGMKSGYTSAAGGCDVMAVTRTVGGKPVVLLAAVTGQVGSGVLLQAGLHALALINTVAAQMRSVPVTRAGQVEARVDEASSSVDAVAASSATFLSWPALAEKRVFVPTRTVTVGTPRGTRIGTVVASLGPQHVAIPVRLTADVPRESVLQRIFWHTF